MLLPDEAFGTRDPFFLPALIEVHQVRPRCWRSSATPDPPSRLTLAADATSALLWPRTSSADRPYMVVSATTHI